MYLNKKQFERVLVILVDLCCIVCSILLSHWIRYEDAWTKQNLPFILMLFLGMYLLIAALSGLGENFFSRGAFDEAVQVVKLHLLLLVLTTVFLYLNRRGADVSRLVFGYFHVLDICLMYIARSLLKRYLFQHYKIGQRSRRLLLVSDTGQAEDIIKCLKSGLSWDIQLSGVVIADGDLCGSCIQDVPIVSGLDSLIDYVRLNPVDEVFIRIAPQVTVGIEQLIVELESMGIIVDLSIQVMELEIAAEKSLNQLANYPVVTFSRKSLGYNQIMMKRLLDIAGSMVGLILFGIAYLIFAPLIKMDSPGPVLFKQKRVGKNGRIFWIYKFRSMYQDAEKRKKELMQYNEMKGLMFKMEDDPRITKIGRFLRKSSIDELPQFWNVLKGDMSLVGTRPPTVDEFEQYRPEYKSRLIFPPGLTGLWQISGRSSVTDFSEVVKLDMLYIDNWAFAEDIKIILQTVAVVLLGRGAS